MKYCCKCCAELNDNVDMLYMYNNDLFCYDCLVEELLNEGIVIEITK